MKRIAFCDLGGRGVKTRVPNRSAGVRMMHDLGIQPHHDWCFITEREWDSPRFRNDDELSDEAEEEE